MQGGKHRVAQLVALTGAVAVANVAIQTADTAPADAAICDGSTYTCTDPITTPAGPGNACFDNKAFWNSLWVQGFGTLTAWQCDVATTHWASATWQDSAIQNGGTIMTRAFDQGNLVRDTHGLPTNGVNFELQTQQVNNKNMCAKTYAWSPDRQAWFSTTCKMIPWP